MRISGYLNALLLLLLFLAPSFAAAKQIELSGAILFINDDWEAFKYEGRDTVFLRNAKGAEVVFTAKYLLGPKDPKTLDYMLEHHLEYGRKAFPRKISGFTGYFIPFRVGGSCRANWFLEGKKVILNVSYRGECENESYEDVENIIKSLRLSKE